MSSAAADALSDADVMAVLEANLDAGAAAQWSEAAVPALRAFIAAAVSGHKRIAVVTSGGTSVPLEQNAVRFVTNFSTGGRGSLIAEALLDRGETVIFVARKGSLLPYHRILQRHPQPLTALADPAVHAAAQRLAEVQSELLILEYETVMEYLHHLRCALQLVNELCDAPAGSSQQPVLFLAAAVSDYYIPRHEMAQHKISSVGDDGALHLTFRQVPKALGTIRRHWAPKLRVISFKLETDAAALESKALANLYRYDNDAVVANVLSTYKTQATVYLAHTLESGEKSHEGTPIDVRPGNPEGTLEKHIISVVLDEIAAPRK